MDLTSAKVEAAKLSRTSGKIIYINTDNEGECTLSEKYTKGQSYTAYKNGGEIALEAPTSSPEPVKNKKEAQQKKKVMSTTKKPAAKKVQKVTAKVKAGVSRTVTLVLDTKDEMAKFEKRLEAKNLSIKEGLTAAVKAWLK